MNRLNRILPLIIKPSYYLSVCCIIKDENSYHKEKINRGRTDSDTIKRKMDDFHYHDAPSNAIVDTTICDILKEINNEAAVRNK